MRRVLCAAALLVGCSSSSSHESGSTVQDGGSTSPDGRATGAGTFTASTTTLTQYQAAVLDDAQASFAQASYMATLGSTPVTLTRIGKTQLLLVITAQMMPGSYALTASADGVDYAPLSRPS